MPFIAKSKLSGERIDITVVKSPRTTLIAGEYVCPLCGGVFIVKAGLVTAAHFAHKIACASDWNIHPESNEHRAGKLFLVNNLPTNFAEYSRAHIELEVPLPEIRRVADVLVTFDNGWQVAHEVQLAAITVEELEERTRDYNRIGIDVVWWLGKRAATSTNERWCYDVFGFCLGLEFYSEHSYNVLGSAR